MKTHNDMRNLNHISKGRSTILPDLILSLRTEVLTEVLLFLTIIPAFFSCKSLESPYTSNENAKDSIAIPYKIKLANSSQMVMESLDIFFFNDDKMRRLDTYQRIDNPSGMSIEATSRDGHKIVAVLINSGIKQEQFYSITCYDDLKSIFVDLKNESPEHPVMYCEEHISTGHDRTCIMTPEPLMAKVMVNSLCCDFHSRPYAGEMLKNVAIYLTNICGQVSVTASDTGIPKSILNYSKLVPTDTSGFSFPHMIHKNILDPVGETVTFPKINFYCYENTAKNESLGTPYTRLVIEGTLCGEKTYYPLDINRDSDANGAGIKGGNSYIFDITLTRKGADSPSTAIHTSDISCNLSIVPWTDKGKRTVTF